MREHDRNDDNLIEHLFRGARKQTVTLEELWNRLPSAPILKHTTQVPNQPQEGMFVVDPTDPELPGWCFFLSGEWYCIYPRHPQHAIKVTSDKKGNKVENGAFRFHIAKDLDGHVISYVEAGNGTAGSGDTIVQISNQTRGLDILSTRLTINSGQYIHNEAAVIATALVGGQPTNRVFWKDRIWIDVDAVGAGSKGLYVYIVLRPYDPTGEYDGI